jgi:predicted transcriptional regulator
MSIPRLPDAELEVMQIIWQGDGEVTTSQIMEALKGRKTWGVTTVLNLLTRMAGRGFINIRREKNLNRYTVLIAEDDYLKAESEWFLKRFHGNSLRSMVAALQSGNTLTRDDIASLKDLVNELGNGE